MTAPDAAPDPVALAEELERLRSRYRKLAEDKSYYQLILQLIELLNPLPGLDDMLRGMLASIVECIGGTNIKLYYWIGEELHYIDFLGENKRLESIDDESVAQAMRTHNLVEQCGSTEEALLMHGMLRGSYTWTFPLLVGQDLVGVIKLENLHIHGASLGRYLPIFCSHAALILGNEIRNVIRRRAEEDLRVASERLRLATEAGLIGIWDWDIVHDVLVWDDAMYRLYGRKAGDFGGAYEAWLAAVHPEDKPLADGEIQAALRGEREYGPEFRVVWPDGSIHHLKAASITRRDADGKPLRMVGINYDLTERKRAEEENRSHLQFLEALDRVNRAIQGAATLEQMMAGALDAVLDIFAADRAFLLYPCDPAAPSWRVPMESTRLEYPGVLAQGDEVPMDPGVADTFHRLLAAEHPLRFGPGTDNPLPAAASERYGFKCIMSMALRPKSGPAWQFGLHQCSHVRQWTAEEEQLFEQIGRRLADGLSILLAQRDLAESELRYRLVFENSPVSVWEEDFSGVRAFFDRLRAEGVDDLDAHFIAHPDAIARCAELLRIVDVNDAAMVLHRAASKEELLAGLARTFTAESFDAFRKELVGLWQGETAMVLEAVVQTLDGERRDVMVHFSVCPGYEQTLGKVLVSLVDISERKRADDSLRRLNRELRAISNCNQALIRAADEPSLLREICRIICEEAGYRMAWVGYAEQDEARRVRPIAWAGTEEGYLDLAGITWADDERGHGPSGASIRSGRASTVDDFATDARVVPWREEALRRGYRSSIALPLKDAAGGTFGILCIYAVEVAAFTADEVRLMEELAGDLAFGISVLRIRAERERAEVQLLASERRFRELVENMPDLVVRYDTGLRRTYVNPAWEAASGLRADEVVNVAIESVPRVPTPLAEEYVEALRQALATGTRREIEFSWVNTMGTRLHLQYVVVPERDEDGSVTSLLAVGRDITERRRAEEESRTHLRFLEALDRVNRAIQGADDLDGMMSEVLDVALATFECDRAFLMYPCDPAAAAWSVPMERNRPEYPGVMALGRVVPMDAEVAGTLRELLAADGPVMFGPDTDHPLPADVSERYGFKSFMSMAFRPKTGKPWQFGIHQCSHARRWTPEEARLFEEIGRRLSDGLGMLLGQRELRESERKLAEAEHIASVGYIDRDLVAERVSLSEETCRILGLPPEQRIDDLGRWNELWLQRVHPDDRARIAAVYADVLRAGRHYDQEYRVLRPDGEVRVVHSRADLVRDENGRAVRMLGTMQDVTERKATEAELEKYRLHLEDLVAVRTRELAEARDAAEAANRAKSIFLSNMSHELRTPLNAILGFAQIMESDARIPADERDNLGTITRSGRHLLTLINDVLEISRIEAGRLKAQPVAFDLSEMLASLQEIVALRAADKGLGLRLSTSPALPRFVVADAGKVRQILLNLLSNAVKYTPQGEIELSVATREDGGQPQLLFSVRDTGVGIAAEDLERIFQPFYQTEYGISVGEGTGLGLTISSEYARLMGGSIGVDSTPGRGSSFQFVLPLVVAEPPPEIVRRGRVVGLESGQAPCRVLVAEDDVDSRNLLALMLRQAELRVRVAADGAKAVEEFLAWHPDFVWMDMRMPVMDGYEATRRIRALPGGDEVKIAALTASAFREDRDQIIAAGCDDVLAKPFEEPQMFAVMERLLGLRFRYAEAPVPAAVVVTPVDLAQVPAELRDALRAAAQRLDVEATRQQIACVRDTDAAAATMLEAWVDEYRYDRIVAACDRAEGN